uniref:MICOS complex subunit n=1 Tax=Gadus morhua TaxID=8049 RepID=A0A8C5AXN3_GADMO
MAAKVVMVAVPTVLGLASLRVYSVTEPPAGGTGLSLSCLQLPIYTPLPSTQYRFVEAKPGVLESGLTYVRESLLPVVRSVVCVSVKTRSIQAYQTAGDVYYYLRDPPPGFLPRLGTITTVGMLGMILARKGSRFKRLAVPLGMMGAGAAVCYPAQTVALLKVSSRKVYAAGMWSSASVSALFASKPKEAVADTVVASAPQPQASPKRAALCRRGVSLKRRVLVTAAMKRLEAECGV